MLDVLAGRKTTGEIHGDILFNGMVRSNLIMRSTAYVMQDNVHIPELTVRESLMYAACLRLEESMEQADKEHRVQDVLNMLELTDHADTIVGSSENRGLSGGQLKRLSIAVEIIHLPDLIFLDEPTTGLDSSTSDTVMSVVKNMAIQNRTVVYSYLYALF